MRIFKISVLQAGPSPQPCRDKRLEKTNCRYKNSLISWLNQKHLRGIYLGCLFSVDAINFQVETFMRYMTTTSIGKKFGRTVHQMKIILAQEGLLTENGPSKKALDLEVARLVPLDPETSKYGTKGRTHFPAWDYNTIKKIMGKRGETPGEKKIVTNFYNVTTALSRIGHLMEGMPGMDQDLANELCYGIVGGDFELLIMNGEIENFTEYFEKRFAPVRETAMKKRGRWKKPADEIIAWLDAIEAFLRRHGAS